jgi:hypothetical protein
LFFVASFVSEDKRWLDVSPDSGKALSPKMNMLCRAGRQAGSQFHYDPLCTSSTGGVTNDKTCDSRSVDITKDVLMLCNSE